MRRAAKRDIAEPEIITALTRCGFSVYRLNQPVDLLAGYRGVNYLIECKSGSKGYARALNENQQEFAAQWNGAPVFVLRSQDDAIAWAQSVAANDDLGDWQHIGDAAASVINKLRVQR
jgi:Holliday junction resolvase